MKRPVSPLSSKSSFERVRTKGIALMSLAFVLLSSAVSSCWSGREYYATSAFSCRTGGAAVLTGSSFSRGRSTDWMLFWTTSDKAYFSICIPTCTLTKDGESGSYCFVRPDSDDAGSNKAAVLGSIKIVFGLQNGRFSSNHSWNSEADGLCVNVEAFDGRAAETFYHSYSVAVRSAFLHLDQFSYENGDYNMLECSGSFDIQMDVKVTDWEGQVVAVVPFELSEGSFKNEYHLK